MVAATAIVAVVVAAEVVATTAGKKNLDLDVADALTSVGALPFSEALKLFHQTAQTPLQVDLRQSLLLGRRRE